MSEHDSTPTQAVTVYLVRRRRENCYVRTDWSGSHRLPGERNVRIFHSYPQAYAFAEELDVLTPAVHRRRDD